MREALRRSIAPILLCLCLTLFIYHEFQDLFKCPSCYLFVDSADGLKNYFTPAYFVKHGSGMWFNGMNYPYGENLVYTDNQPVISTILKATNQVGDISGHVIGTINMMMVLSIIISALILYFIFRELGVPRWYAALASAPIALLAPQIARFDGHYSLAHTAYLPFFLYLVISWSKSGFNSFKWGAMVAGWIVWMGFTHLYYFFIASAFLFALIAIRLLQTRLRFSKHLGVMLACTFLGALILYGTVKLTDSVPDRPQTVYGLSIYTAKVEGTFLPYYAPFDTTWNASFNLPTPNIEGMAYVGAIPTVLLPLILIWLISQLTRQFRRRNAQSDGAVPVQIFLAGILVWSVSTGWFYDLGGDRLVDTFPVLGQFRSLGRLAWIFYYTYTLSAAYLMYMMFKLLKNRGLVGWAVTLVGAAMLVWYIDANNYLQASALDRDLPGNTVFRGDQAYARLLRDNHLPANHFQAIYQAPMVSIGSEKLHVERGLWHLRHSFQCAWETGLPIVNSNMSRTSISQTTSLVQMMGDAGIEKTRLNAMDDRPFLFVISKDTLPLIETEKELRRRAVYLGEVDDVEVYSLQPEAFDIRRAPVGEAIVQLDFEETPQEHAHRSNGALMTTESRTEFFTFVDTFTQRTVLEYASWGYIGPRSTVFPAIHHTIYNIAGEQVAFNDYSMFRFDPFNADGNWLQTRFHFPVDGSGAKHVFTVEPAGAVIDDVTLR